MMGFDLLSEVNAIVRDRGLDPLEYRQTLREANLKRWGNSSILRNGGIGIDEVYDEFKAYYPWMFESLDDFVEALEDRLSRTKNEEVNPETVQLEEYYTTIEGQDVILLMLQGGTSERALKQEYTRKAVETLEEDGLVKKEKRRFSLSSLGIHRILQRCLEVRAMKCAECNGSGKVTCPYCLNENLDKEPCYECNSKGALFCPECDGTGVKNE